MENQIEIFKALSNKTRLEILKWLKDPLEHFDTESSDIIRNINERGGVSAQDIQEKAKMSQSTISHYLKVLQKVGFLESKHHAQWTYYRRNEEMIKEFASYINNDF
ncbi:metalloregulator ArsR/SmtB family transcription factor (plasmid) [Metabacillus halosaccharovorans]|uniref:ArsR/SmtB family transcription factor n=1 Tax=Metabacillus halosaccharovorans TaxID=930124 RepID=UPI00203B5CCB|nr:metalloregulator ArsR/SmtB family transcription factor [Metabacillus halosaccharovorans]MCM3444471.1 helix-turn-helix domain-containing protein [Metabacillus halosaccharovorans]